LGHALFSRFAALQANSDLSRSPRRIGSPAAAIIRWLGSSPATTPQVINENLRSPNILHEAVAALFEEGIGDFAMKVRLGERADAVPRHARRP